MGKKKKRSKQAGKQLAKAKQDKKAGVAKGGKGGKR